MHVRLDSQEFGLQTGLTMVEPPGDDPTDRARGIVDNDAALLHRLRQGEEEAFVTLIEKYQAPLRRFLRSYLPNDDLAEDVTQETWLAVLGALDSFEGRSLLKTWIFRIGAYRAQARMRKERRLTSFASLKAMLLPEATDEDLERLLPASFSRETGMWAVPPARWDEEPETKLISDETVALVRATIKQLPSMQAAVITLRDMEHWTPAEVCEALEISEANQRVLLHRARVKVRKALERHFEGGT